MSIDEDLAAYYDNRSDPSKTADRYDEIIRLRMFLYDLSDLLSYSSDSIALDVRKKIDERASTWSDDRIA